MKDRLKKEQVMQQNREIGIKATKLDERERERIKTVKVRKSCGN